MASITVEDLDEQSQPDIIGTDTQVATQSASQPDISPKKKSLSNVLVICALVVVIALGVGLTVVLNDRSHLKNEVAKLSQSQQANVNEANQLNDDIRKLIQLPADEVPTVATVIDAQKVKGQAFFVNAQNGDKLLLYSKSGKAILYRPTTQKIIEVAPINLGNSQPQSGTTTKNQ